MTRYQIYVYVPQSHLEAVKQAMFDAGAGNIGHYSQCCWQTLGNGQYLPSDLANPYLGQAGNVCEEDEYKVEIICLHTCLNEVITSLKNTHPFEEPAFGVIKLESF